jgi:hypothetical protein
VLVPLFPIVHNNLLCSDHVEGQVVVLALRGQDSLVMSFEGNMVVNAEL